MMGRRRADGDAVGRLPDGGGTMIAKQVIYIGDGQFLPGMPACDMTMAEWEALPEDRRELALRLELYQVGSVKRAIGWNEKSRAKSSDPKEGSHG